MRDNRTTQYSRIMFCAFLQAFHYLFSFGVFFWLLLLLLFFAALSLRCCMRAFSSCGEQGLLFIAVCVLLIVVASLCYGAQALGTWAQ